MDKGFEYVDNSDIAVAVVTVLQRCLLLRFFNAFPRFQKLTLVSLFLLRRIFSTVLVESVPSSIVIFGLGLEDFAYSGVEVIAAYYCYLATVDVVHLPRGCCVVASIVRISM